MHLYSELHLSPDITIGNIEHRRLLALASAHADADWLLSELERATIVADYAIPRDVVRMGSTVSYRNRRGYRRVVTVVFPHEADIEENRVSVLTPVGATLIGLREGQSISYRTRAGNTSTLTILKVTNPYDDDDPEPMAA